MSDELKACSICGNPGVAVEGYVAKMFINCVLSGCANEYARIPLAEWQSRPLEDALRARKAGLEELAENLVEAGKVLIDGENSVWTDKTVLDWWHRLVTEYEEQK